MSRSLKPTDTNPYKNYQKSKTPIKAHYLIYSTYFFLNFTQNKLLTMKTELIVSKLSEQQQNAFWYFGEGEIARICEGDREIIIYMEGEIRVYFSEELGTQKNEQAVEVALDEGYTDADLEKLEFEDCNWFDFEYSIKGKEPFDILEDACFSYDEALKFAQEALKDDEFWEDS